MKNAFTLLLLSCFACLAAPVRQYDTVAAMLAQKPIAGETVLTGGPGGLRSWKHVTSITGTTNTGNAFAAVGGGYLEALDKDAPRQDIRWWGAIKDDGLDDSAAINAALEFANAQGRRVVEVPPGDYHQATSIVMQTRVRLIGTGSSTKGDNEVQSPTNAAGASLGPSRLILLNAANCTQIVTGPTNGLYVRQPNEWNEDGSTNNSVEYNWGLENLVLYGNGSNQTRYDCHGIKLDYGWNFYIRNVQLVYHRGYKIWCVDLNQINIDNVGGLGAVDIITSKPWSKGYLIWGSADSLIREIGGGFVGGPGIWLTGSSSWQNHIEGCFIYNCLRQEFVVTGVSTNTGQIDLAEDHVYETGMPAEIWPLNGGVNPVGLSIRQPYWVIKVDGDSIKLAATRADAEAGTAIIPSTEGSDLRVWHGPGSGIYANWGASQNTIVGGRYDQNEDSGIVLHDTSRMAIVGNNITFNGFQTLLATNAAQAAAGVELSGYCYAPVVTGNIFNQLTPWYRQDYGIWVRSNTWAPAVLSATQRPIISGNSGQVGGTNYFADAAADNLIPLWHADGPVHIGLTNSGSGLIVTGNSGGVPTMRLVRNSSGIVADMGIGVGDGSFNFSDWKNFKTLFLVDGYDSSKVSLFLGANTAMASPRDVTIYSETGTGTDVSAGDIELRTGAGTGSGTMPRVAFLTSTPTNSGTAAQTVTTRAWLDTNGLTINNEHALTIGSSSVPLESPAAGRMKLYSVVNGSSKVELVVKWPDGSTNIIATQP